jgi:coproporphyrinogen III oxidase
MSLSSFSTLVRAPSPLPSRARCPCRITTTSLTTPAQKKTSRRRLKLEKSVVITAAANSTSTLPSSSFTSSSAQVDSFAEALFEIQDELLRAVEELDGSGAKFLREPWTRAEGAQGVSAPGRGLTAVLEGGALIEKGAASVTHVSGALSAARAAALASRGVPGAFEGAPYAAAALSIVFHSRSPHVPTLRGDVRVFSTGGDSSSTASSLASFGGGADLTPFVLHDEDVRAFHGYWKRVCDEAEE